jgi:hypothetical protein
MIIFFLLFTGLASYNQGAFNVCKKTEFKGEQCATAKKLCLLGEDKSRCGE